MAPAPDLIVAAARAFGVPGAAAVAVRDGRIVTVGGRREVLALRGPGTRFVDAPHGLLCPGFHDAHIHLGATGLARLEVDVHGLDLDGFRRAIADAAAAAPPGRWLIGRGFDPERFPPNDTTARAFLDAAAPDHPVLVRSHDYHACALNTAGLTRTGFLPEPPDVPGGRVERGASGEPNGLLREAAEVLAGSRSGDLTDDERADAVAAVLPELFRAGVTALHDMSGSRLLDVLAALDAAGRLPLDVFATVSPEDAAEPPEPAPARSLRIIGMKAFLDGALGSRTAHLLEPYESAPGRAADAADTAHRGIEVIPPDLLAFFVGAAARSGLPSFLHAIGDGAVRAALDAVEAVGVPGLRHRVEHAQMVHDADLARFSHLGVVASVQPVHMAEDAALVHRHWGGRSRTAFPLRRLVDSGARVAFGSDAPIETFDVLEGVRCAVRRTGRDGTELHPEEALTVAEAIRCYTSEAAWAAGREEELGSLAVDRIASLTLLSEDVEIRPEALDDCTVAATVVRGDVVFEAGP